jgi:hypothetical protein
MKVLILVANEEEGRAMSRLSAKAGLVNRAIANLGLDCKLSMKELRQHKAALDAFVEQQGFDVVVASGETAARLAFDKPIVNITKLRGRDFEYKTGCRTSKKEKKA